MTDASVAPGHSMSEDRPVRCSASMSGVHLDEPDRLIETRTRCHACHFLRPVGAQTPSVKRVKRELADREPARAVRRTSNYRETSRVAYHGALPSLTAREREVLDYLAEQPDGLTADEFIAFRKPEAGHNGYSPVFTGLIKKGILRRSANTRLTRTRRPAAVHYLAEEVQS